jgi:N-acetylmuramoyl-L-alanine amidase
VFDVFSPSMWSRVFLLLILIVPAAAVQAAPAKKKIYLDAGHGFPGNEGAQTLRCETEREVVLELSEDLAKRLRATGKLDVRLSRTSSIGPSYPLRAAAAEKFGAEVLLSVHLDSRGNYAAVDGCPRNDEQRGFAILYSDEGSKKKVNRRRKLSRAIATEMSARGFLAYDGYDYSGLYEPDPTPGVFIDRRGLFMLRRPSMTSVIIETFHGLSRPDRDLWDLEETRGKFAAAVEAALE